MTPHMPAPGLTPGALGAAMAGPEGSANQLTRIISALRRFGWLILLVTVVGGAGSVVATKFLKPQYVVPGTIWVETRQNREGPIQAPGLLSAYNWVELLRTYAVLDPVVKERRLYLRPGKGSRDSMFEGFELRERFAPGDYVLTVDDAGKQFTLKNTAGNVLSNGAVTDSVGTKLGFGWLPGPRNLTPGLKAAFTVLTPRDASAELNGRLSTKLNDDGGNFLNLSLTGEDPVETAATLNSLEHHFVDMAADLKRQKLRELSQLLGDQLKLQETKLREAEIALQSFRVSTITQPRDEVPVASGLQMTSSSTYDRYFQQRIQLETIKHDRESIEQILTRLAGGESTVDAFSTVPAVQRAPDFTKVLTELSGAEADLRGLRTKYTDEFKPVRDLQEKIATIRQSTVPQYAQALITQLKIQENELNGRIKAVGSELQSIPTRAITEARLSRDMESSKNLFINLQNRWEEARLAETAAIPDVRILVEAVPPTRAQKNQAGRIIFIGLVGSIAVGLALALLLDRIDRRFRYPEQASHELGLTILGAIPVLPRSRNGRGAPSEETAQIVEAFRSIRLNLAHSFEAGGRICLTISSPSPGDGKSLIASNLALSFAEAGYRTLLIDGDIRRGELHRTFNTDRRPGLLDYLGGSEGVTLDKILRPTSHQQLTLISCGTRVHHGPELLGSGRMAELIALLKGRYDVILIDSPPLGAGIDPFVLGTHTANMMVVLRAGETDRQMAEVKLQLLDRLPVRMLGAVLNHISAGTGAYKYYSYSYGYAAEDEGTIATEETRALVEGKTAV